MRHDQDNRTHDGADEVASRAEATEGAEGAAAGQEQQAVRLSPDDWAIINARFQRLERTLGFVQTELGTVTEVANRADQRGSAHQPFVDMVRAAAVAGTVAGDRARVEARPLDGRTLMVLGSWCAVLLTQFDFDTPATVTIEVTMTPEQQRELRSAMANVKYAMEHMKTYVGSEGNDGQ